MGLRGEAQRAGAGVERAGGRGRDGGRTGSRLRALTSPPTPNLARARRGSSDTGQQSCVSAQLLTPCVHPATCMGARDEGIEMGPTRPLGLCCTGDKPGPRAQ